ncbi:Uncharacterised protein [Mycobacteroides abscessus subsp. abscessus]|nr:Uncharacterised protein [Mycobacteroides abscessus subsp. abscessus]
MSRQPILAARMRAANGSTVKCLVPWAWTAAATFRRLSARGVAVEVNSYKYVPAPVGPKGSCLRSRKPKCSKSVQMSDSAMSSVGHAITARMVPSPASSRNSARTVSRGAPVRRSATSWTCAVYGSTGDWIAVMVPSVFLSLWSQSGVCDVRHICPKRP